MCMNKKFFLNKNHVRMQLRVRVTLLAWMLALATCWSQTPRLYTVQHGLNTSNFKSVCIDSKGIVWMTGTRLLTRFDGASFHDVPSVDKATGKPLFSICNGLKECGFECIKPQGAFYLFVKSPVPNEKEFCEAAKKYNILIVPGSSFACPGYVRLAYCVSHETIVNSLPKFKELAKEYF